MKKMIAAMVMMAMTVAMPVMAGSLRQAGGSLR